MKDIKKQIEKGLAKKIVNNMVDKDEEIINKDIFKPR